MDAECVATGSSQGSPEATTTCLSLLDSLSSMISCGLSSAPPFANLFTSLSFKWVDKGYTPFGSLNPFGDGTTIKKSDDGVGIARVDHKWQQKKGSKISDDGFHKEGFATITLPKEIDVNTPEGDKKAGDFVEHLRAARKRGAKIEHEMKKKEWEDRKVQVTVNKE